MRMTMTALLATLPLTLSLPALCQRRRTGLRPSDRTRPADQCRWSACAGFGELRCLRHLGRRLTDLAHRSATHARRGGLPEHGGTKLSEHGGFNEDDVHTALLVALDGIEPATIKSAVSNQQVAPTIIKALGLDPDQLQAVRHEQIHVLPFLFHGNPHED